MKAPISVGEKKDEGDRARHDTSIHMTNIHKPAP